MHKDASFELSKTVFRKFFRFFITRGDPYGEEGSEHYAKGKDRSKTIFKVIFLNLRVFPVHINVRLRIIPNLVFYAQP